MTNFYFNLTEKLQGCSKQKGMVVCTSNPDGQPTVNRQSAMTLLSGKKAEKEQLSSTCLRSASELPPFRSRYLRYAAMIFAVLVMSMANIGTAWGDTYADVYTNPASGSSLAGNANGKGAFSVITPSGGVSFGNSSLQISSNGGSGSFTVASIDGSYITSIAFTSQSGYPINTLTSEQGTITIDGSVYTFTPSSATLTSATFSMSAQSSKKVRVAPITVNLTSDHSYLSMNFGVSSGTVSCTKSTGASGVTLTTTGSASSNRLSVGSGKTLTFTSTSNIESIHFTFVNHATVSLSASTGTYNSNTWTPNSDTKTVTFTSSGSNVIGAISIKVAAAAPSCTAANLTASNITSNGDQEAGTGITFSKVGSPASGDTWYWQTSATGTDKTYNATSPYTTATTAGSYTVYLRAYNTSGDCWGTAASMTNTIYPAPSAMIHNTFAVNAAWSSTIATQDKTNITSLNAMAAVGESVGSGSNKDGLTQKIPSQTSEDASKYMSLSFNVASGKQLNVTSVVFDEQPVTGTGTFKVSISDNQGSTTKTQTIASDAAGSKHTLTLDGDIVGSFKGTVTVKVWAYGWGDGYRFGDYFYIHGTVTDATACSAPSSVTITGTNKYLGGQTISLTATPDGGTGTATYQWQKEINSVWTNVTNGGNITGATSANLQISSCTHENSGQYRCIVSTGAACSKNSDAYGVHVFSVYGKYYSGEYSHNEITWTSGTTGTATIHLNASSTYLFKVWSNDGYYYGNGSNNYIIQPVNWNCGTGNDEMRLLTGPEGDYTFTVNIEHGLDGSPYVNVQVGYPTVSHPSTGYMYITKWWDHCYVHYWEGTNNDLSPWGYDPEINSDRYVNICGTNYWYFPVIDTYNKFIAKDAVGDAGNSTGDQVSTDHGGKYITNDGSWGWHDFTTYTISFNAGGGTGTMDAIAGICPNSNQEITANAFEKTGHTFNCWHADVATKVGGSAVAIGGDIAGGATLQEINNNITLTAQWTPIPVSSISVAPSSKTLEVGGTQQLTATVSPANALNKTVTWSTSNGSVATVSNTGLVTAVAAGTCTITATANDGSGKTGTCSITVEAAAAACYTFTPATSGSAPSKGDVINGTGSGGTMVAGTGQSYTANGLKFESSGDYRYVTVTLDNNLKEGSVIAVTMWMDGTSSNRGLYLQTSAGTQKAEWKFTADSENHQYSYTVEAGDGLINTNVFRLARINNVYLKSVTVSNCGDAVCTTPTTAFANGAYTVGGSALDLSTLISGKQGSGTITYTVKNANSTGASIDGTNFTATSAGTATVTATQAANGGYCEKVMDATITVSAAGPSGDCDMYFWFNAAADATTAGVTNNEGSFFGSLPSSSANSVTGSIVIDGTTYNVTQRTSNTTPSITFTVPTGKTGKLYAVVNGGSSRSVILKQGSTTIQSITWENSCAGHDFDAVSAGTYTITSSGNMGWCMLAVKVCDALTPCTTPVIPTLSNQSLCEGGNATAWNATQTASLETGETVSYQWQKKNGSNWDNISGATSATYDVDGSGTVTEAMAGTYRVVVTVSRTDYADAVATKEVTLSVTDGIEVTGITADKATVYPTNSVTLTATASATATWQWYTCTSAEGAGEAIISGAESASYTIASADVAGTYYYKAVAIGSCGTAERVYTLVVSPAAGGDCFHYVSVIPTGSDIAISSNASIVTPTHATTLEGGTMKVGSSQVNITKNYGLKLESSKTVTITLDAALEAGNVVIVKGTSGTAGYGVTINGVHFYDEDNKSFDVSYTVVADDGLEGKTVLTVSKYSGSSYLQEIKITGCGTACTDPEVTASVNNSTACVGSSVTFTATGAHASATYQWQKYSGGTWTNISGSGATASTYTIASVVAGDAGKYRVIASHDCNRTSNEVTLNVPVAPVFADFTATRSVMATQALSITDVEASDATSYAWYKSADATYDAGTDTKVGTTQELLLASGGEAAGDTYYLFCVASNACGSTTSSAITVNVTALVEEDCATRGTEGAAEFGFQNSGCGQGTYNSTACWTMNSNSKILVYSAPDGKYFKTMKVTIASSSASKASYNWSTDGGSSYTDDGVAITGVTTTLTEKTIDLSAHGNVNEVKIGRNFGNGESSGTLYVSKICFEYTSACTATTVTPSATSKTHTIGASFTAPTFTLGPAAVSSGTLTYSSSDEEIASVDESGNVTFNGTAGIVTITAAYAGATIADVDYCASEGSYTITVSCSGGAPKIVAASSVNLSGCNSSVTLNAKTQAGADFAGGSYQWFRNGEEIAGATGKSYSASQAGVYTVAYTSAGGCTSLSTNNATVTSATVEPEVTKLVPFHYYHVDKTYTAQMKDRHLFSVKGSAEYGSTGKNFKLTMSRNGEAETDMTTAASIWVNRSDDGQVDSVMIDLNKLSGKYNEGDELVLTCAAVDCSGNVSAVYKDEITINVIGATPTLALICSGTDIAAGTRTTSKLTVGGDFLTGYNKADLCQQTGNTSFDANTEWGLYTRLKENYIVTPVNGYAVFNKLNYEPFDILLLTDYPKASKSDAAATVLDDMADLCDYRPMLSFKAHMVAKSPSKWAAKGFTTSPVVPKNTRTRLNIVCYAHPMFADMKTTATHIQKDNDDPSQIVYTMLTGAGYEGSKGLQGFELEAAENFVTIGLVHYNATPADGTPSAGLVTWTPGSEDRMLVTAVERQENIEARMIMFAVNCGAQSKFTETGRNVVLKCLEYLLDDNPLHVADCSFTFDNGAGNSRDAAKQAEDCPSCTGTKGDGKWSTAANWGPDYVVRPGKDTEVKIAAPVTVDPAVGAGAATNFTPKVRSVRILEGGQVTIPAGSYLEVVSTIRHQDGNDIYPTEANDIVIGSSADGNGTLIFNNNAGDTKARVAMYSTAQADVATMSAATSEWQYIGTPHSDVVSATRNYYDSWLYQYDTGSQGWTVIPNGGPLDPFRGYCVTHPTAPVVYDMSGTLVATTSADIAVPANKYVVAANSWVAPIDINAITDDDMENISEKAIYFFNTGSDPEGDNSTTSNATDDARWAAGTYVSVPIHSAPYTGDDHIPSMQGFYVWSTTAGTLHLDYDRHVRGTSRTNKISGRMHAPKRVQAGDNEPEVLKIIARGNRYDDRLVVLEREDYTRRYDSGWDGEAWGGSDLSPMVYITNEAGVDEAVSAIPEFEGTVITFRAGEDSEYRFEFTYSEEAEPLYLLDTDNNTYTQVVTGNEYYFTTYDKSPHKRFVLTRKAPQIATGTELTSDGEGANAKKLLIEDKMYILLNGMLYDATGKVVK